MARDFLKISKSEFSTILIFIGITLLGLFAGLMALFFFWFILMFIGIDTDFWAMTGAMSTAVAATTVLGAGFIAIRELSEISSSRYMEVANQLFEELNSLENIEARRWVFQSLPTNPEEGLASMNSQERDYLKRVLNSLDHVSFLTQAGWIPEDIVMPWMHPMIIKSWIKLESYVEYERKRRNEPYYYKYASELAERCMKWRTKNLLKTTEITWVDDAL